MRPEPLKVDLRERGGQKDGDVQFSDRRLFFQLQVFTGCTNPDELVEVLKDSGVDCALYLDVNDPQGVGVLLLSEDPEDFAVAGRAAMNHDAFLVLERRPHLTMMGRTYLIGYELDLDEVLVDRPRKRALDPKLPWVVWYPLRRNGDFAMLEPQEKKPILGEHGRIGRAYAEQGKAYDIRLACHGIDENDNEFLVALLGPELAPLSKVVEHMRGTQQTAKFIAQMGPFFVGKVHWQSPL